jgi:hypothetical protein
MRERGLQLMDAADKLMAQLLTSDEVKAIYDGFGPDVAYLVDKSRISTVTRGARYQSCALSDRPYSRR